MSALPGSRYGFGTGTSMATPHVTGAVALLRSVDPAISVDQVFADLTRPRGHSSPAVATRIPATACSRSGPAVDLAGGGPGTPVPTPTPAGTPHARRRPRHRRRRRHRRRQQPDADPGRWPDTDAGRDTDTGAAGRARHDASQWNPERAPLDPAPADVLGPDGWSLDADHHDVRSLPWPVGHHPDQLQRIDPGGDGQADRATGRQPFLPDPGRGNHVGQRRDPVGANVRRDLPNRLPLTHGRGASLAGTSGGWRRRPNTPTVRVSRHLVRTRCAVYRRAPEAAGLHGEPREADVADQTGAGTKADPWVLQTPPGTSSYTMYIDEGSDPPSIVCQVGGTQLRYDRRAIDDLHAMLKAHGDWMPLGGADEQKPAPEGSVEAWGRSADNPIGGWYGLKKGLRGRFGVYMPPLARGARPRRADPRSEEQPDAGPLRPMSDSQTLRRRRRNGRTTRPLRSACWSIASTATTRRRSSAAWRMPRRSRHQPAVPERRRAPCADPLQPSGATRSSSWPASRDLDGLVILSGTIANACRASRNWDGYCGRLRRCR